MKLSFRFARVFGIDLKVHATFALILVLGAVQWATPHGARGAVFGVGLMLALFACVLLHELGHCLVARAFGIPTKEIILLPIGGLAMLSRMPKEPIQELLIAVAGPLVNVAIGIGLYVAAAATGAFADLTGMSLEELLFALRTPSFATMLVWLLSVNISLVLFNLVPAFPLDGGRMLRATLAFFMDHARATRIAAGIGQLFAVGIGVFAVATGNLVLALVAVFIFIGAGTENYQTRTGSVLSRLTAGEAYNRHALGLEPSASVEEAVNTMLTSHQSVFAVHDEGRLVGLVTREDLVRAMDAGKAAISVAWIMRREMLSVPAGATLDAVRTAMVQASSRVAVVEDDGRALGLITLEDIAEAMVVIPHLRRPEPVDQPSEGAAPKPPSPPNAQRWI